MANRPSPETNSGSRDVLTEEARSWAELWRREGRSTVVHIDSTALSDGSGQDAESHRQSIQDALAAEGAPENDRRVVERILSEPTGVARPNSRFLVVADGETVIDHVLAGPMATGEMIAHTTVPNLLPLLAARCSDVLYLIVEAGREGGEIHVLRASQSTELRNTHVEGRSDSLNKVQSGGWSHSQYQDHSEEIWKQNQGLLAEAVDKLVREIRPRLVVLAGDVRAVQLLSEELSPAAREISTTVSTHVRAPGASRGALDDHVAKLLEDLHAADVSAAIDRLSAGDFEHGAVGIGAVIHALQQGQVETLLIDPDVADDRTLFALASEPWVASAPEEALGVPVLESVPAAVAIARAALVSDSALMFMTSGRLPAHAGMAAVLRWPTGPAVPGTPRWTQAP